MNEWRKHSGGRDEARIRPAILVFCLAALIPSAWLFKNKVASRNVSRVTEPIQLVETPSAPRDLVQQQKRRKLKAQTAAAVSVDSDPDIDLTHVGDLLDDRQNWIERPNRVYRIARP